MRKKKNEKYLFNFLMWLPIVVLGVYSLCLAMSCINHSSVFDISTFFYDFQLILVGGDSEFLWNQVSEAIFSFGEIIGIPSVYSSCFAILVLYWVSIELLALLFDFIIFIPRAIRSLVEKGM